MFDLWWGKVELTTLTLILAVAAILPLQLLLCFKGKRLWLRLLPLVFFLGIGGILLFASLLATGWAGVGYILLAVLSGLLMLSCGIAWGIWGLVKLWKKREGSVSR